MNPEHSHLSKKERRQLRRGEKIAAEQHQTRRRFTRRIALWSSVLIGIGTVVFMIVEFSTQPPASGVPVVPSRIEITPEDWIKGESGSKVVLVEYSDFQCPACGTYYPILKQLYKEFGDRLQFVYRHFPLEQHRHADLAARAAEAAGRQGRIWEMHDLLFEGQATWANQNHPEEMFIGYARQLGLDIERFRADLDSREGKKAVEEDRISGNRVGVNSTPTFFLDGVIIQNPRNYDEFRNLLQQAIESRS